MKNATILRLASILLILTLMIGMIPAASASNEVYFPVYMGNSSSIVDALRSLDIDPSYQNRERIAAANGIPGYTGTASQNTELFRSCRNAKALYQRKISYCTVAQRRGVLSLWCAGKQMGENQRKNDSQP